MKSTLILACFLLSSVLPCFSQNRGETRIIGNLNTGEPVATAPAKALPDFQVQDSRTHRVGERNVTVQKVAPPESATTEPEAENSQPASQPQNALDRKSRNTPSFGLIFLTAKVSREGGSDLEIWHNGNLTKAWSSMDANCLSGGFTEFMANGRRYHIMALVIGRSEMSEAREDNRKGKPRRAKRGKREAAPRYFLTGYDGDQKASRQLLKDLHDLYRVEKRALWWAYRERVKNQAKREAELKANPPRKQDVIIRYWKTPAKK